LLAAKSEMIERLTQIFNDWTFKAEYMFPNDKINECKTKINRINNQKEETTGLYDGNNYGSCDYSRIVVEDDETVKSFKKKYTLIKYEFYFSSPQQMEEFKDKLDSKGGSEEKQSSEIDNISKYKVIQEKLKYTDFELDKDLFANFCEYINSEKDISLSRIKKKFSLKSLEFEKKAVRVEGLQEKIENFSSKELKDNEYGLNAIIANFAEFSISSKTMEWDKEQRQYIAKWPNILFNDRVLGMIKTLDLTKFMNLKETNMSLTTVNKNCLVPAIRTYLAKCLRCNLIKDKENDNSETALMIDETNFIEMMI